MLNEIYKKLKTDDVTITEIKHTRQEKKNQILTFMYEEMCFIIFR